MPSTKSSVVPAPDAEVPPLARLILARAVIGVLCQNVERHFREHFGDQVQQHFEMTEDFWSDVRAAISHNLQLASALASRPVTIADVLSDDMPGVLRESTEPSDAP